MYVIAELEKTLSNVLQTNDQAQSPTIQWEKH